MQKNQMLTLTVTDLNNLGFGVAHHEGMTVFVGGAADGEIARARVILVKRTYAVARTEEILTAAPWRVPDDCPAAGCGGCAYRRVTYAHEQEIKRRAVCTAFRKAGLPDAVVNEVVTPTAADGTPLTSGYRNKAQYPIARAADGSYLLGFYGARTHRVVEAAECPLQDPAFAPILADLRAYFTEKQLSVWDGERGLLRHVYLRRGSESGEVLLTLVIGEDAFPDETGFAAYVMGHHPAVVGVVLNVNREDTNVICGNVYRTIGGRGYLVDTLAGVRLRIHPAAFYQVNHAAATLLYAKAAELAGLTGREQLLDLYCGTGSIGLSMAHLAREVIGVELTPEAVECATLNARESGIENARFYRGDAGDARCLLDGVEGDIHPDVVVLDPPRKGSTPELLTYLAERAVPRIVYVSCNPDTLARDAQTLRGLGYRMGEVTPFDLFPRTGHVECVTVFRRTENPPAGGAQHRGAERA